MAPGVINEMIGVTPGAVRVKYGGVSGWGHDAHVPTGFGDGGATVVVSEPSVVVASEYFPGVCLDSGAGTAEGVNEAIEVKGLGWYVRAIEPGEAPGEIRLMLTERSAP